MRTAILMLTIFCWAAVAQADEPIPAKILQELKRGTVFLQVKSGSVSGSGSGFLIHRDRDTGYIITNSHVVPSPPLPQDGLKKLDSSIEAVFFSGTPDEVSCQAELVANLPDEDLALLRVKGVKKLPVPLKVSSAKVTETMPVFCLGFPYGKVLGVDNQNPALTISRAYVSSLRHNREGELAGVQLDGNLNPGNSGGPVVDKEGRIIGVAVAVIRGAPKIAMAIPAAEVAKIISGRPIDLSAQIAKADTDGTDISIEVELINLLGQVRSVTAHYLREDAAKKKPVIGQTKPLAGATKVQFTVKDQKAAGSVRLPENEKVSYWLQIGYTGDDRKERFLGVMALRLDASGRLHLVRYALPDNLDHLKKGTLTVHFSLVHRYLHSNAAEHIKARVGNPIIRSSTHITGFQVAVHITPVDDPHGFLERLQEIGKITKIQGSNVYLTLTNLKAIAEDPDAKKEAKPPAIAQKPDKTPMAPEDFPRWTLDLEEMKIPDRPVAGKLFGQEFTVASTKLNAIVLTFNSEKAFPSELTLNIHHRLKFGEGVSGKVFHLRPEKSGPTVPVIFLTHRLPDKKLPNTKVYSRDYAMKLEFGKIQDGKVAGRIYLCLPDLDQSVVAGTFILKLE